MLFRVGWRLTIRSSRDRFAARLARFRVPPRLAAARPGLTQVLGSRNEYGGKPLTISVENIDSAALALVSY